jgi:CheY-like chemotaxis protein
MHILIVDDDPAMRRAMEKLLRSHGHRVGLAANGREAVEMATKDLPDVVFMDLNMPVMDGLSATRLFRGNPETAKVPVVCISAHLNENTWRAKAFGAGCVEYLPKPVDWDVLDAVLAHLK